MSGALRRRLGRCGLEVSGLGFGCWALSGPYTDHGQPAGWGVVDDAESIRAVRHAIDLGVTLFDTAECYGAGHSERVLGEALAGLRHGVAVATKFGHVCDEAARANLGPDTSVARLESSLDASLRRLRTDHVELLQLHLAQAPLEALPQLVEALERMVVAGKIRAYGWSTDDPVRAAAMAQAGTHCSAVQHHFNVLEGDAAVLEVAEAHGLASLARGPLAKGILTGKFTRASRFAADDVRHAWRADSGPLAEAITLAAELREALAVGGRTPAQGALAWLWARSPAIVPIPGFKTRAQVEENAGALTHGPLAPAQMEAVASVLERAGWRRTRVS